MLMSIENSDKWLSQFLPNSRYSQKVLVLREQDPSEPQGSLKQEVIVIFRRSVFLARQYIYPPPSQSFRDGHGNMHVHVDRKRHAQDVPAGRRFKSSARKGAV